MTEFILLFLITLVFIPIIIAIAKMAKDRELGYGNALTIIATAGPIAALMAVLLNKKKRTTKKMS